MNQVPYYWRRNLRKLISESLASGRLDKCTSDVVSDFLVTGAFHYMEVFGGGNDFSKEVRWALTMIVFPIGGKMSASICCSHLRGYLNNEP